MASMDFCRSRHTAAVCGWTRRSTRPAGWLSIARSQSWNTPRLLADAGVGYMLDWVNDELPYRMTTPAGDIQVVAAKFAAAIVFYTVTWLPMLACLVPFARWPRPVTCTGRTVGRPVGW